MRCFNNKGEMVSDNILIRLAEKLPFGGGCRWSPDIENDIIELYVAHINGKITPQQMLFVLGTTRQAVSQRAHAALRNGVQRGLVRIEWIKP